VLDSGLSHRRARPTRGRSEIRWLVARIKPLLRWHLASFLCLVGASFLALLTPLVLKWIIDHILPERDVGSLILAIGLIFVAQEGKTALNSFGSYLMLTAAQKLGLNLRTSLLRHLDTLSADYYEEIPASEAMYPLKEPVDEVSVFGSDLLPAGLRMLLTTIVTLGAMFLLSPVLTLVIIPLIPIFLITRQHYRKQLSADADDTQSKRLASNNFLQEHVASALAIQLLGQEKRQERKAFCLWARSIRSQQRLNRTGIRFTTCSSLPLVLALCGVLGYGGASVLKAELSVGSLVAFYGFVAQLFEPLSGAAELYVRTQKVFASIRQLQAAFALKPQVLNSSSALRIAKNETREIELREVKFGYRRQPNLLHISSLRIGPGEQVAIAGENGAGKSTLAKLIARLYDPLSGSIKLGGLDLRDIDLKSLRDYVCYLPRDPVLFDGSVISNLRLVRQRASLENIDTALAEMGLSTLVATLPHGLHQRIGPGGCQLSGGQRQRLALARALLQEPRILILDEATSCLDAGGEAAVLRNLQSKLQRTTFMVVSHRYSTLSIFPRMLILADGRIQEDVREGSLTAGPTVAGISIAGFS